MKVGLALSGGGARGVAHLGVIKALEEAGIEISMISASSAGAMAGALYASGISTDRIVEIVRGIKKFKFLRPALSLTGLLNMDVIHKFLESNLEITTFGQLKIPLVVAATNINTGRTEYFDKGDLVDAVCSSSCIPVIFEPVLYNGNLYMDGGMLNNLPVEPLKDHCDVIIGSHCNPIDRDFKAKNVRWVMERALMLAITCNVYSRKAACDYFIEPKGLEPYKVMDLAYADKMYEIGYTQAVEQIEQLKIKEKLG